jgi:hypothetical protein
MNRFILRTFSAGRRGWSVPGGSNQVETWVKTLGFIHKSENGKYLKSIAYGANGNRLEAYPILRCRLAAVRAR